jgi:diguanylate cyclase (GGDEF)-like protein/PAS domain S-box-containing protein
VKGTTIIRAKVLIVDDKETNIYALKKILEHFNVDLIEATNGSDALELSLKHDFALAILDVQMPIMDGYELAELLRDDEKTKYLPIIFVSAIFTDEFHIFRGYEAGAVDFLSKPLNAQILCHKVNVFLEIEHQRTELLKMVELEKSKLELENVLFSLSDSLIVVSKHGKITRINQAAMSLLNYSESELLDQPVNAIFAKSDNLQPLLKLDVSDNIVPFRSQEKTLLSKSRTSIPVLVSSSTLKDENRQVVGAVVVAMDISPLKQAEAKLSYINEKFRTLTDSAPDVIIIFDSDNKIVLCNRSAERTFGYAAAEVLNQDISMIIPVQYQAAYKQEVQRYLATGESRIIGKLTEAIGLRKDGTEFPLELAISVVEENGQKEFLAIIRDLSERYVADKQLKLAAQVFSNAQEGITITDKNNNIQSVNRSFEEITGYLEAEVKGKNPSLIQSGIHDKKFYQDLLEQLLSEGKWRGEVLDRRKNGEIYPAWMSISAIRGDNGDISGYISLFNDLSAIRKAEDQLLFLSNHDTLTGLPNRLLLNDRVQQAMDLATLNNSNIAMLLFNVDSLQLINDSLGHSVGDNTLRKISDRLSKQLIAGDTLARLGSDEFVVVLTHCESDEAIISMTQKLLIDIARPFQIDQQTVKVSACVGIALFPDNGLSPETLLKSADVALSYAKSKGSNSLCFCTEEMNAFVARRRLMNDLLGQAIELGQLELYYQPKASLYTGNVSSMEALIRWNCPQLGGVVGPVEFIPIAEANGLILSIGEWVIYTACRQNKAWQDAGLPKLSVAVNVSPLQFLAGNLPMIVKKAIDESHLEIGYLEIEITESAMMIDSQSTIEQVNALRQAGILFSLDDFGTGYSSLSSLSQFAIDKLKIDQCFVREITSEPKSAAIAHNIIALAQGCSMTVIAEGVETEGQLSYLQKAGCDEIQGYLYSRPLTADEFVLFIKNNVALEVGGEPIETERVLLIVDDEHNILNALKRTLRRQGFKILSANSGMEALELLAKNEVQVIVSDQRMPHMSGTEFLSRASEIYPHSVRIILSEYTDLNSLTDVINRGDISKFITKPWDDDYLSKTILKAFKIYEKNLLFRKEKNNNQLYPILIGTA